LIAEGQLKMGWKLLQLSFQYSTRPPTSADAAADLAQSTPATHLANTPGCTTIITATAQMSKHTTY